MDYHYISLYIVFSIFAGTKYYLLLFAFLSDAWCE